jgi:hypothetical protein
MKVTESGKLKQIKTQTTSKKGLSAKGIYRTERICGSRVRH